VLRQFVAGRLEKRWSPQQVSRALPGQFPGERARHVVHETIYQAVYRPELGGLPRELPARVLRTRRRRRRPHRRAGQRRPNGIIAMTMIDQRPAEAAGRTRPGHGEGDLITGAANRSAIGTLVDRASRYTMLLHLPGRHSAEAVRDALIAAFWRLPPRLRRSLTWDQGKEMALHAEITAALGLPVYFCEKASPWQRPSNENTDGLLRQYFPRAATCARTARPSWRPWRPSWTPGRARRWPGTPPPRGWACDRAPGAAQAGGGSGRMGRVPDMRRRTPEPPPAGPPDIQVNPGMADELLRELAPLLAGDGIDVSNINRTDPDTLQQALGRAVERHNMAMFTPVGHGRELAAVTMRLAAEAIAGGDTALAAAILDHSQPEAPDGQAATVAGCIGLTLALLDQWLPGHGTSAPPGLAGLTRLPAGHWTGERAARDILTLARKGRAFASLDALIARQGGQHVLYGSALILAAALQARAPHAGTPLIELARTAVR
jgi:hypothetical protein